MELEMKENDLVHCIYISAATDDFLKEDIISILELSRENNAKLGITGILLYDEGSFFQVLEGKSNVINSLYEKLLKDRRHTRAKKIVVEPIETRCFSEWTMGYTGLTKQDLNKIDGLNDFFVNGKTFVDLDEQRVTKLLDAFKDGRWRSSIS